jgi:hypothetical protein
MTKMRSCFEQLAHGKIWQSHEARLLYRLARRAGYPCGTPDGDKGTPFETHPRVRSAAAYRGMPPTWQGEPAQAEIQHLSINESIGMQDSCQD